MKLFTFASGIVIISTFCRTNLYTSEAKVISQSPNSWTPQPNVYPHDDTNDIFGKEIYISEPSSKGNLQFISKNM